MNKITTLTIIAGLATALTTMAPLAAVWTHVPKTPNESSNTHNCADDMGFMRGVTRSDIQAINGQHVAVIAVCEDLTVAGKNNYGSLFNDGNAGLVRVPIGRNNTLMSALRSKNYDQHDVVSVRFGANDTVILYVHQRDMN